MKQIIKNYYGIFAIVTLIVSFIYNYALNFSFMVNRVYSATFFRGIYYFIEFNIISTINTILGAVILTLFWGTLFLPIYLAVRWSLLTIYKFLKGRL